MTNAATLTLAWDPDGGGTTGYVLSYGTQSGVYTSHIDVGNQTQFTVDGLADFTTYYFVVQAYNSSGMSDPSSEVIGQTDASGDRITGLDLSSDQSAPQPPNTTINWTASATGGVQPYSFKWWAFDGQTWTPLSDWTPYNTYAWQPTIPNVNYRVGVWAKSAWDTNDAPEIPASNPFPIQTSGQVTSVDLTSDLGAPEAAGTTITFTAAASGGTQPYSFKWWVFDGQTWMLLSDWNQSNTYAWTPLGSNPDYRVGVWVKSAGNPQDLPEFPASVPFPITDPSLVTSVSLTPDQGAPQPAGTTITWTAVASGGTAPYWYKWWVFDGQVWTLLSDWTSSNTYAWTPTESNPAYRVGVWVKSANDPVDLPEFPASQAFPIY